jgi:recombination protein RecT
MPPRNTVSTAVANRKEANGAQELITRYSNDFATVLPSHVNAATWVRLAQGALRRGKRITEEGPFKGRFELEVAAANNSGAFLAALLDAARQGLEPGTEQYYLTPRKVGGRNGRLEILGITGYQGHIELMYRSGAVTSVNAEVVREHDEYRYQRGIDLVPTHRFKPFARDADRGALIGTYAYARMATGDHSRIIELNIDDIERVKRFSQGAASEYSPWVNHEAAMWLKSGARQLQKWVPTSAEYRRELARAAAEAQRVAEAPAAPAGADQGVAEYLDGEVVDEPAAQEWPDVAQPGGEG